MLKYDDLDIEQAIEDTYEDCELKALADLYDGADDPFYKGLRVAFAYQQLKINKQKEMMASASQALENAWPENWSYVIEESQKILNSDL